MLLKLQSPVGWGWRGTAEEKNKETVVLFLLVLAFITFLKMLYKRLKLLVTF